MNENQSVNTEHSNDWKDYKFSSQDVVGSYRIQKDISANDIESVIINSFEGGSNYWLGLNNATEIWKEKPSDIPLSTWATKMLLEGHTLDFYDAEDEETKWSLTLEQLVHGFKLNATNRPHDCDLENGDAITSDCIIQFGIFGEIAYG